ncbi:sensor histidine kinase [Kibdelosporangium aridum]|uniref:histidine kinase n=1 Tax=Kibdelosporangium aridum TaxID=2030 RepID=A0A1Y5Y7F4_KIBAR|nr:nitrate- and nitrite sensing domain-containing protein [Kibdelosporangium aridum]SMD26794.1 Signal transduction histidine kinase [Kibdelosporangium aridum]
MPDQNAGVAGSSGFGRQAVMPGGEPADIGARPQGTRAPGGKTARAGSPWRMRNWRLRTKVLAVLIIPTLTALALGGLRAQEDLERAEAFRQTVNQVDLANNVTKVVHELQKERTLAVDNVAADRNAARAELDGQINTVNNARQQLSEAAQRVNTDDEGALERYNRGLQRLAGLDALRQAAKETEYPHIAVKAAYTSIIEALVQLGREVNTAVTDRDLLRQATTVQGLSETKEFASQENAALQIAATVNSFPSGLLEEARAAEASFQAAQASFRANATPQELQFYSDTVSGPEVDDRERIKSTAFNKADNNQGLGIDKAALVRDGTVTVDKLRTVEENLLTNLRNSADVLATARTNSAWTNAAIVLALLIAALILMALVTRSILKPLRVLRTNALDVAYTRLPETVQRILADPDPVAASKHAVEPMPVFTREETGEVARSFDAVHEQAVRMAAEQALLRDNVNSIFVNLSRRSQALVERQLNLIDRLEQDEQDPDQLASLFELDHLATRMRRNSESLLVLSGTGLSRQLTRPVPAADVVGAAVSEVEQYARIEVLSAPEVAVQGRAVNDLVHLIAELLDNATSFSEPEKKVTVRMAATRKKELAIQITDQGVGMSADEIEAANRRLADPPDMDVSVTRRMGLYVVARLAQRHNIQVRLRDNEDIDGGLIARIIVPASLIQSSRGVQATNLTPTGGIPTLAPPVETTMGGTPTGTLSGTGTMGGQRTPPPASRPGGGIANAFTGSLPRVGREGGPEDSDPNLTSMPSYPPPAYPPATENATNGSMPATGGWAPDRLDQPPHQPGHDESTAYAQPLQQEQPEQHATTSLFGDAFAAEKAAREAANPRPTPPPQPVNQDLDAPTERLPIYEAVLSQWFEEGDSEKRAPASERGRSTAPAAETSLPRREPGNATPPPPPPAHVEAMNGDSPHVEQHAEPEPVAHAEPQPAPQPEPEPQPEPTPAQSAWQSPGDEGWQAAQALTKKAPEVVTSAGLPKRVPKAQLIPGSAPSRPASPQQQAQRAPALPPRSADAVRGRMSSFQQGIRRGRHAMAESYAGDQDSVESRQDEEQE